jgi:NADH dehydrogenase (ubiquinone) 1 alpha subcomplex subunit 8
MEISGNIGSITQLLTGPSNRFNQHVLVDTTPMPEGIPKVQEIGATSAPLMSASFFIGDRCKAYNDDYMKCKAEANGRGELDCLQEGRKVTRCAASVYVLIRISLLSYERPRLTDCRIKDINTHCLKQFNAHWECLENNNHHMFECRKPEMELNNCVFEKLVRTPRYFWSYILTETFTGLEEDHSRNT